MDYRSTAEMQNIDCRRLGLQFEFYDLDDSQVLALYREFILVIEEILDNQCVCKHTVNNCSVPKNQLTQGIRDVLSHKGYATYILEAYVQSPVVFSIKSMREYAKMRAYALNGNGFQNLMSTDFSQYWNSLFPQKPDDPMEIKAGILQIFQEKGKHFIGTYPTYDIQACFTAIPDECNTSFHGYADLEISVFCLNDHVLTVSECLSRVAIHLFLQYKNISTQVFLQPCSDSYKRYFRRSRIPDDSQLQNGCHPRLWQEAHYLAGCEWMNIVSPRTSVHLANAIKPLDTKMIIQELGGGGLVVQSSKTILEYDVDDALKMKKYLYPALRPGYSSVPLRLLFGPEKDIYCLHPRSQWEIVPIFDEEVKVVGRELFFTSLS